MDISSLTSASATNFLDPTQARATGQQTLSVTDFLKLITVQLTNQDPMKPMDDSQFISQMASFTSLQQTKTLSDNFTVFSKQQDISSAQDYLGRNVTVTTANGDVTGPVTAVTISGDTPRLTIGGQSYDPANVTSVTAVPAGATPSP